MLIQKFFSDDPVPGFEYLCVHMWKCTCVHMHKFLWRSVSAQQACYLMLWLAPWGGQQNHLIDGAESRAGYLHACFAEQIHTER